MKVIPFVHEGLGNSSYLVQVSPDAALVVDPDRSAGQYLREAEERGLRIAGVLETHLHADFVTGVRELLDATGVAPHASAAGGVLFPHRGVAHGDAMTIDGTLVRVIGSPGHTPEHVSYVLEAPRDEPSLLFSGGSLIVGGAARTDLVAAEMTEELTRAQYRTLKKALAELPDETLLYPTHGGGSFCSAGAGRDRTSTLGRERATNPLLRFEDEEEFVRWFPGTFPGAPRYFFKMRPINQAGPRLRREIADPPALSPQEFRDASDGAVIVDARPMEAYQAAHIRGSLSIAFRPAFATWLGWLVEVGKPLLFVSDEATAGRVLEEALLVGQENFAGRLAGGIEAWERAGFPVSATGTVSGDEARKMLENGAAALDVREPDEYAAGHLPDAVNIPLGRLADSVVAVPNGEPTIAYCGHGERSTTAASILEGHGIAVVNLDGGFDGRP
jgi:glyoxylase-like metal-dependent hydrolase (beta-lactamase superfamily II)/rhodanese-related sulfurtransferase